MRNVTVAAVQMKCSKSVEKNIAHAEELVRQAAAKGAEIVLLPELFERPYFCQERRYEYYEYALRLSVYCLSYRRKSLSTETMGHSSGKPPCHPAL